MFFINPIKNNAHLILENLITSDEDSVNYAWIQSSTGLSPQDINDAVNYLNDIGAVSASHTFGTAPFDFSNVFLESKGKFLFHELNEGKGTNEKHAQKRTLPDKPLNPVGSPFGFSEQDWVEVVVRKSDSSRLYVVLGMQFVSNVYNTEELTENLRSFVQTAVDQYNSTFNTKIELDFKALGAGLGEHLFNQIARDIISADIAFFETSDLNPNVMIEMGVALTWGTSVIPIKEKTAERPPSDISGQTWVNYSDSCKKFDERDFTKRLVVTIKRVIERKGSHNYFKSV